MSAARTLVPVDLGGSPTRCALSPPRAEPPTPELVRALIDHYTSKRTSAGDRVEVAFFRGGLPDDSLLSACGGLPARVACSPADLSAERARQLCARGVDTVELEVLSFETAVLRACRRGYTGRQARAALRGLTTLGLRVGVVLSPGLPGTSHASTLRGARSLAGLASFARILPALAFRGSALAGWATEGRWRPLSLAEAITTSLATLETLESLDIEVIRVGLQPGQDVPHAVTAGPFHPDLRGLVEMRRFRARMAYALGRAPRGGAELLRVHPKDLSWAKGTANENVRALRAHLDLREITLQPDPTVARGTVSRG